MQTLSECHRGHYHGGKADGSKNSELPLLGVSVYTFPFHICIFHIYIPTTVTYLSALSREIHQGRPLLMALLIFGLDYTLDLFFSLENREKQFIKFIKLS